jgi:hypothetical protein
MEHQNRPVSIPWFSLFVSQSAYTRSFAKCSSQFTEDVSPRSDQSARGINGLYEPLVSSLSPHTSYIAEHTAAYPLSIN